MTYFIEHCLELGSVLVSEERRIVRFCSSPKEMYILEGNSHSVLYTGLGKSIRNCVTIKPPGLDCLLEFGVEGF